jgi:hypothetical protein
MSRDVSKVSSSAKKLPPKKSIAPKSVQQAPESSIKKTPPATQKTSAKKTPAKKITPEAKLAPSPKAPVKKVVTKKTVAKKAPVTKTEKPAPKTK